MSEEKCFCHFNGFKVKDAFARSFVSEKDENDCFYRMAGEEREWINPPMVPGVEYRTIERFNGKPVYTKLCILNGDAVSASGTYHADTYPVDALVIDIKAMVIIDAPAGDQMSYPLPVTVNSEGSYTGDYVIASNYRHMLTPDVFKDAEVDIWISDTSRATDNTEYHVTIKYVKP